MKVYKKGGKYLVVLGDIPQWLVVDYFGLTIVKKILSDVSLRDIKRGCSPDKASEALAVYREIFPIVTRVVNRDSQIVENSLTAKTTVAMIAVTRNCNLQSICPHCYIDAGGPKVHELTVCEHKRLALQIKKYLAPDPTKVYKVNLTGGEPFFHPQIINIIQAYLKAGLEVNMSTNGLLVKDSDIQFLSKNKIVLSVSLDGATPAVHDRIRGQGSFLLVNKKIRKLVDAGVKVGINCLVHNGNFFEFEKTIILANDLGCSGFNPINLVQLGRACNSGLSRVSEVEMFKRLRKHLTKNPDQQHLFKASSLFSSLGAALLAGITCESCGVGNRPCVYVDEIGDVYPCPNTQRREFLLGSIRRTSLYQCVKMDNPVLQNLRSLQVSTLNRKCSKCDVRFFCGGDCRGETYNVTGNLNAPYLACNDRHDSIIELMWAVAGRPELFESRANEYISNLH